MSLFNVLPLAAWVALVVATPDLAQQPLAPEAARDVTVGAEDENRQPFESPDQIPKGAKEEGMDPMTSSTGTLPQESVIPENEREVPQGQY